MKEKEPMLRKHGFFFLSPSSEQGKPTNKMATSRQKEAALYSNI